MTSPVAKQLRHLTLALAVACSTPSVAQTSVEPAAFDLKVTTQIHGSAVRIRTRPPFLVISADQGGEVKNWRVDFGGEISDSRDVAALLASLRLGDVLVVAGNPSTTPGDFRLRATRVLRPNDGRSWQRRADGAERNP